MYLVEGKILTLLTFVVMTVWGVKAQTSDFVYCPQQKDSLCCQYDSLYCRYDSLSCQYDSLCCRQNYVRRHLIAVRTNLLHDFLYVPQFGFAPGINIQLEYYPKGGHYTYNAAFTFISHRHWDDYKFFQIRDLQLELRRYFKGEGKFIGPYLAAYAEGTFYGIGFNKNKGWEGEGGGGGLSAGYVWPLNRKGNLRLEVSASLGFFYTRYDPYVYGNPITGDEDGLYYYDYHGNSNQFKERNHRMTWLGPTNAGIHITYDIIYRKKQQRGCCWKKGGNR